MIEYNKDAGLTTKSHIILTTSQQKEMLRIAEDGFYVRGVRIEQDADEAKKVYVAFKEWFECVCGKRGE